MSFSGVGFESWPAVMAANAGVVRRDAAAAVPMRRPTFAASALRESGSTSVAEAAAGCVGAAGAPEVAMAAVLMPRNPGRTYRRANHGSRASFIEGASFASPKVIAPMRKISRRYVGLKHRKTAKTQRQCSLPVRLRTCQDGGTLSLNNVETFRFADLGGFTLSRSQLAEAWGISE